MFLNDEALGPGSLLDFFSVQGRVIEAKARVVYEHPMGTSTKWAWSLPRSIPWSARSWSVFSRLRKTGIVLSRSPFMDWGWRDPSACPALAFHDEPVAHAGFGAGTWARRVWPRFSV